MNLRSVFTLEQQRILQRYYENGMTNQSKNCFQMILQCAQEAKLEFSVVRTWVGNKRRKMLSKSNSESTLPAPSASSSIAAPAVEVTIRSVPNSVRTSSQQATPSPSSSDFITGVYTPTQSSNRQVSSMQSSSPVTEIRKSPPLRPPAKSDIEFQQTVLKPRQISVPKSTSVTLSDKTISLSRHLTVPNPSSPLYIHTTKNYGTSMVQDADRSLPKAVASSRPYAVEPVANQKSFKPEHFSSNLVSSVPKSISRNPIQNLQNLEICEVFSLATPERLSGRTAAQHPTRGDSGSFSIAMETGNVDDEYAKEEELACMGAQIPSCKKFSESNTSQIECQRTVSPAVSRSVPCTAHSKTNMKDLQDSVHHHREYPIPTNFHSTNASLYSSSTPSRNLSQSVASNQQRHPQNQSNYQISGNLTVPWISGCSRKRTLQERTLFSDHDLAALKKYWDNGMTSLGSICREKIEAVAAELNVDCEIVKTWIGNRRRKYRLMGIDVPPPRGGPADFADQPVSGTSPLLDEETGPEGSEDNDQNDELSVCSSEEESSELVQRDDDREQNDRNVTSAVNVKIEEPDDEDDMISNCDVDQLRTLLEFKNEEVRYLESELHNYKQKYFALQNFTAKLILAVKSNDTEQQQALVSCLPPEIENLDFSHTASDQDDTSQTSSSASEKSASESLTL
ncbi:highly divergent homeobox isoform X2 [Protopterus annectens]|nr:highly divergent homeobox isoform X2 [Protopterus annectens]